MSIIRLSSAPRLTIKAIRWIFLENNTFRAITGLSAEEEKAAAQSSGLDRDKSGSKSQLPPKPLPPRILMVLTHVGGLATSGFQWLVAVEVAVLCHNSG